MDKGGINLSSGRRADKRSLEDCLYLILQSRRVRNALIIGVMTLFVVNVFRQRFDYLVQLLVTTPQWGLICLLQILSGLASFLGLPLLIPVLEMMQTHTDMPLGNSGIYTHFLIPIFNAIGLELNFHTMLTFAAVLILIGQLHWSICFFTDRLLCPGRFDCGVS